MSDDQDEQTVYRHEPEASRFVAEIDGHRVGVIDYALHGSVLDVTHTGTEPARRGQGLAGRLTRWAMDTVRDLGYSVRPSCPYTASWIAQHPTYADLLEA